MPELEPCPFCGEDNLRVFYRDDWNVTYFVAYCPKCATEGPVGNTEEEARRKWNVRHKDQSAKVKGLL